MGVLSRLMNGRNGAQTTHTGAQHQPQNTTQQAGGRRQSTKRAAKRAATQSATRAAKSTVAQDRATRHAAAVEAIGQIWGEAKPEATLEDGLRHLIDTIDGLTALDTRIAELEKDLVGHVAVPLDDFPSPAELGIDGYVPRLQETAMLIGAVARRAHLRVGMIEGAVGLRARPVDTPDDTGIETHTVPNASSAPHSDHGSALDLDQDILKLIQEAAPDQTAEPQEDHPSSPGQDTLTSQDRAQSNDTSSVEPSEDKLDTKPSRSTKNPAGPRARTRASSRASGT